MTKSYPCRIAASIGLAATLIDQTEPDRPGRCRGVGAGLHSAAVVRTVQQSRAGSATRAGRGARAANLLKYKERYLLLIPALVLFLVFRYVPMAGIVLAWKQFTVTGGLFGSPWAGWSSSSGCSRRPTSSAYCAWASLFIIPIIFALLLNEVANLRFKRVV